MATVTPKSFFERPEGNTGYALIFGGVLLAAILFYNFMDKIILLLENTLYAGFLGAIILVVIAGAMNPKLRATISYMFRAACRKITATFIEIDPIGILKSYIEDMGKQIGKVQGHITELRGQMGRLKQSINDKVDKQNHSLQLAQQAKKSGKAKELALNTRSAGRSKDAIKRLNQVYDKMEVLYRVLNNMKEKLDFLLRDTIDTVEVKEDEFKSINAAHKAMSAAKKLIAGEGGKKALFEQTMQHIADDVGMKMGEMEDFMSMSENFMDNVDLEEGVFSEEGMKMLEDWENKDSFLLGDEKESIISQAHSTEQVLDFNNDTSIVVQKSQSQFKKYL